MTAVRPAIRLPDHPYPRGRTGIGGRRLVTGRRRGPASGRGGNGTTTEAPQRTDPTGEPQL